MRFSATGPGVCPRRLQNSLLWKGDAPRHRRRVSEIAVRLCHSDLNEEAVKQAVEALRKAILAQDKATLETLAAEELSYSHSDAHLEDKTKFINAIMTRKAVFKSLEFPELTVAIVGDNAVVRHLWVSESELDGKVTNAKIGVLQVWQKQDSGWKLLARASFMLPQPT